MINDMTLGYLILALPLLTFVVNGLFLGNNLAIYATAIPAGIYFYMGTWKKRKALVRRRAPAPENTSGQDSGSSES